MRIVKINGKEQIMKCNIGVLKRSAKALKIKTPELFPAVDEGDAEVGAMLLFQSIFYSDKKFEMESIDDLRIEEYRKLIDELTEEITSSIPDATGGGDTGKK